VISSDRPTLQITGENEAQRSLRPNERIAMCFYCYLHAISQA
jgi:hypothetical protein